MPHELVNDSAVGHARRLMDGFGRHLRDTRQHYEVSMRALAEQLDITPAEITRIERARMIPTTEQEQILREWLLQHPLPTAGQVEGGS